MTFRYNADSPARHLPTSELRAILRAELKMAEDIRQLAKEIGISVAELRRVVMPECPDAQQAREFLDLIAGAREIEPLQALRERLRDWDADDRPGQDRIAAIGRALDAKLSELRAVAPRRPYFTFPQPQWVSSTTRSPASCECARASASGW